MPSLQQSQMSRSMLAARTTVAEMEGASYFAPPPPPDGFNAPPLMSAALPVGTAQEVLARQAVARGIPVVRLSPLEDTASSSGGGGGEQGLPGASGAQGVPGPAGPAGSGVGGQAVQNITGATSVDMTGKSTLIATLTGNAVLTLTNLATGPYWIYLIENATGGFTCPWPSQCLPVPSDIDTAASVVNVQAFWYDGTHLKPVGAMTSYTP